MPISNSTVKARNDMIDFLISEGEGGAYVNNKWVPVFELSDPELVQLYDIVRDNNGGRIDKQFKEGILPAGRIRGGCHPQNKRNGKKISQTRAKICLTGIEINPG